MAKLSTATGGGCPAVATIAVDAYPFQSETVLARAAGAAAVASAGATAAEAVKVQRIGPRSRTPVHRRYTAVEAQPGSSSSSRLPQGPSVKKRATPEISSSQRTGAPAEVRRSASASRSRALATASAGCALP